MIPIIAYYGSRVFPENDTAPNLAEIGIGLGRTARFAGQTKKWFPVLAHTFTVVALVRNENKIHALLHDAPEAIVGDVPTPWKGSQARANEATIIERIYRDLNLCAPDQASKDDVHQADYRALIAEAHVLGHADPTVWEQTPDRDALWHTRNELRGCRAYIESEEAQRRFVQAYGACRAMYDQARRVDTRALASATPAEGGEG